MRGKMELEEFVEKHMDEDWDWDALNRNPRMTSRFFSKHPEKITPWILANPSIDPAVSRLIAEETGGINLDECESAFYESSNPYFYPNRMGMINWTRLSMNPALTPSFIMEHEKELDWQELSRNPAIIPLLTSSYSLEKGEEKGIKDKIDWFYLALNPELPSSFWRNKEVLEKLNLKYLAKNPKFTMEDYKFFVEKVMVKKGETYTEGVEELSKYFWAENPNYKPTEEDLKGMVAENDCYLWKAYCKNPNVPFSFFLEYMEQTSPYLFLDFEPVLNKDGKETWEDYNRRILMGEVKLLQRVPNQRLTKSGLPMFNPEKFSRKEELTYIKDWINWDFLCKNPNPELLSFLSSLPDPHKKKIKWKVLSTNDFVYSF